MALNISSNVLAQDTGVNHVLEHEDVIFTAAAHLNDSSSNFTDFIEQSPFYFKFQYRNFSLAEDKDGWSLIRCVQDNSSATLKHSWNFGGRIEFLVELLSQDDETLACNSAVIQIAGNIAVQAAIKYKMLYSYVLNVISFTIKS